MREIRPYGSEGGAAGLTGRPYPYVPLSPFTSVLLTRPSQPMHRNSVKSAGRPFAKRRREERSAPAVASRGDGRRGRELG